MGKYFNLGETDPIVAECIRRIYRSKKDWVLPEEIVDGLLDDPMGKDLVERAQRRWEAEPHTAPVREWQKTPRGWARVILAWFSRRITQGRSHYERAFERKPDGKDWAYRPNVQYTLAMRHRRDIKMSNPTDRYEALRRRWEVWEDTETDQKKKLPCPPLEKPYPADARLVDLIAPQDFTVGQMPLIEAINRRESHRTFTHASLSLLELSFLLWATQGVKEIIGNGTKRTVPSAGGRHP